MAASPLSWKLSETYSEELLSLLIPEAQHRCSIASMKKK